MLPFFTPFVVNTDNHTLKPYMAQVNHNVLNEKTWVNIFHTFMGNFCLETNEQNVTAPMEDMGHDACVIVACHKKCECIYTVVYKFSKTDDNVENYYLPLRLSLFV